MYAETGISGRHYGAPMANGSNFATSPNGASDASRATHGSAVMHVHTDTSPKKVGFSMHGPGSDDNNHETYRFQAS